MAKTILIIEDEHQLVELLSFRLEANGYAVETAFDGERGLEKIKNIKPDLVLLDVMMPKMHGYEVCMLSKQNNETKDIPIIMLTACIQEHDREESNKCGADAFITKPFEPEDLMKEVNKLLKTRS